MEHPKVYTESEIEEIVCTLHNIGILSRDYAQAIRERADYVESQQFTRKHDPIAANVHEQNYRKGLEEGDTKMKSVAEDLRKTLETYGTFPESMQRSLAEIEGLDLAKIEALLL
jgi:hypothetical protein